MARPPEIRAGHYPYQAPIDAYGDGGFRFADMSHRGSLLCLPTGMFAWDLADPAKLDGTALEPVIGPDLGLDVFFIGTGESIAPLAPELREAFRARRIIVEAMSTGSAVRTYNVLLAENRAVGAALIAVEGGR